MSRVRGVSATVCHQPPLHHFDNKAMAVRAEMPHGMSRVADNGNFPIAAGVSASAN